MERHEIISAFNSAAACSLAPGNTHVSSVNTSKDVWWYDLPVSKFSKYETLNLLAFDQHRKMIHQLNIPTKFLKDNMNNFAHKKAGTYISIELAVEGRNFLKNVRSGGQLLDFSSFHKVTV